MLTNALDAKGNFTVYAGRPLFITIQVQEWSAEAGTLYATARASLIPHGTQAPWNCDVPVTQDGQVLQFRIDVPADAPSGQVELFVGWPDGQYIHTAVPRSGTLVGRT
jgi:hypothetical protein